MKKSALLLIGLVLLLAACGESAVEQENLSVNNEENNPTMKTEEAKYESFIEHEVLAEIKAEEDLTFNVVLDKDEKRIILLEDQDGYEQYKSILHKKTNRLKIIQFEKGQIFSGKI